MEQLLGVLDGEVKYTATSVGKNGIFYAAALESIDNISSVDAIENKSRGLSDFQKI